jgi:endonuclease/exonuclease/phosphatase family metal-dependent hydrolase
MGNTQEIHVASYNIHKGLSHFNRRLTIHEMRDKLNSLNVDLVFLQEVQGIHEGRAARFPHWPEKPQLEFLADTLWTDFAYGKNAVYDEGHHGNAILSRYPILAWENLDISSHLMESRGMLHCELHPPGWAEPLHCINVHLALTEGGRSRQVRMIAERIRESVPQSAPLMLAGDFNDWRMRATRYLGDELGLKEVFEIQHGRHARSYPSMMPLFSLDRIYVRGLNVKACSVHAGPVWHRLSDHAALTATLLPE